MATSRIERDFDVAGAGWCHLRGEQHENDGVMQNTLSPGIRLVFQSEVTLPNAP